MEALFMEYDNYDYVIGCSVMDLKFQLLCLYCNSNTNTFENATPIIRKCYTYCKITFNTIDCDYAVRLSIVVYYMPPSWSEVVLCSIIKKYVSMKIYDLVN